MQVNIHPELAELFMNLYRDTVEAAEIEPTPEQDKQYSAFVESVKKATRRERRKQLLKRARNTRLS
jgi:hypothetical protein